MDICLLNNKKTMHKLIFKVNYDCELKKNKLINRVKKLCKHFKYSLNKNVVWLFRSVWDVHLITFISAEDQFSSRFITVLGIRLDYSIELLNEYNYTLLYLLLTVKCYVYSEYTVVSAAHCTMICFIVSTLLYLLLIVLWYVLQWVHCYICCSFYYNMFIVSTLLYLLLIALWYVL